MVARVTHTIHGSGIGEVRSCCLRACCLGACCLRACCLQLTSLRPSGRIELEQARSRDISLIPNRITLLRAWLRLKRALAGPENNVPRVALDSEQPLLAQLLSAEQMERHGKALARSHKVSTRPQSDLLLGRLSDNQDVLDRACDILNAAAQAKRRLTPAGEWLLDNIYLIEEQISIARRHLPKNYSRELPKLTAGPAQGLPRVYDLALNAISHGDGRVDAESLSRFIAAYQTITPLNLGELWAIPIMLRFALIENLRRISARLIDDRTDRNAADLWADRLIKVAETDPKNLVLVIADMARSGPPLARLVRGRTCAPPARTEFRACLAVDLDRAVACRQRPHHRADGANREPAAGGGAGVGEQQHRQPAFSRDDGLARIRRDHERGRCGIARGPGWHLRQDGFRHARSLPPHGRVDRAPRCIARAGRGSAGAASCTGARSGHGRSRHRRACWLLPDR